MEFFKDHRYYYKDYNLSFKARILGLSYSYIFFISCIVFAGIALLYSAGNLSFSPWALRQFYRYGIGLFLLLFIGLIDIRFFMKHAYKIYGLTLILLVAVDLFGTIGMGAQRWLDLGFIRVQPSELMKISLIVALARYFHTTSIEEARTWRFLLIPLLLTGVPFALIAVQPDLGTALFLAFILFSLLFVVGVQIWKFCLLGVVGLSCLPIAWMFLHDYQKQRVLTFLTPEADPLGAGYHIIQSKIAFGSGGLFGKGFGLGTQSHLNFLPEKQTDFIFTLLAEEFGMVGCYALLVLYLIVIGYGIVYAIKCNHFFGKILALGLTINFSLYVLINMAMVMGLIPVVGVPLPLVSYGGTALVTLFIGFGLIESVHVNSSRTIGRLGSDDS